jgi:hypothetical protein
MGDDVGLARQNGFDHAGRRLVGVASIAAISGLLSIMASTSPSLAIGRLRLSGWAPSLVSRCRVRDFRGIEFCVKRLAIP